MVGKFLRMHTLNLDFSASLTSFREDCFSCMPSLKFLSLCETKISNLWTTSAALANLPSLVELRFQNCLYIRDEDHSPTSSGNESNRGAGSGGIIFENYGGDILPDIGLNSEDEDMSDHNIFRDVRNTDDGSSDDSEVDFSSQHQDFYRAEVLPDTPLGWEELTDLENEVLNFYQFCNLVTFAFQLYHHVSVIVVLLELFHLFFGFRVYCTYKATMLMILCLVMIKKPFLFI